MNDYRPPSFSLFPPVVKNLLIANVLFFIATMVIQSSFHYDLTNGFGLHYFLSKDFKIYQFVTYMFLHGGFTHIAFNMFALWMFGNVLENFWGSKRFILFYIVCGIGAGLTQEITEYFYLHTVQNAINLYNTSPNTNDFSLLTQKYFSSISFPQPQSNSESIAILSQLYQFKIDHMPPVIGASGAIFGVLLAFGMLFPNTLLYVYFAIPVKAKYFVVIYGLIELYAGIANNPEDNVAHFAHLGGMIFGLILILYWKQKRTL